MELVALPDGKPGVGRQGIAHTLKHYLHPSELWEDVFGGDAEVRPFDALARLPALEPPIWEQWEFPGDEVRRLWSETLAAIYRRGYLAVVRHVAKTLSNAGRKDWRETPEGRWVIATRSGVVLLVAIDRDRQHLVSALRPKMYPLRDVRSLTWTDAARKDRCRNANHEARRVAQRFEEGEAT